MKQKLTSAAIVVSTIIAAASPAAAATLAVSQQSDVHVMFDVNDQNAWYAATEYNVGTQSVTNVAAGAFRLTSTDAAGAVMDFLAFCLEPLEGLVHPKIHEIGSNFTANITQQLNTLAANAWQSVTDHRTAAAFQMAAWEITTETSGIFDVDAGYFQITGDGNMSNQAEITAQGWLDNLLDGTWSETNSSFMILNASGTQDLITNVNLAPVPLPSSGLTLLAAMGVAGAVARRRTKKAA